MNKKTVDTFKADELRLVVAFHKMDARLKKALQILLIPTFAGVLYIITHCLINFNVAFKQKGVFFYIHTTPILMATLLIIATAATLSFIFVVIVDFQKSQKLRALYIKHNKDIGLELAKQTNNKVG